MVSLIIILTSTASVGLVLRFNVKFFMFRVVVHIKYSVSVMNTSYKTRIVDREVSEFSMYLS